MKSSVWKTSTSSRKIPTSLGSKQLCVPFHKPKAMENRLSMQKTSKVDLPATTKSNSLVNIPKRLPPTISQLAKTIPVYAPRGSFSLLPFLWFLSADDGG